MKQYVFLFPITGFVESAIRLTKDIYEKKFGKKDFPVYIDEIIEARYRDNDYEITWVFYRKNEENHTVPYLEETSKRLNVMDGDRKISNGFKQPTLMPNAHYILGQLPEHDRLVLGGFHQFDCVDRVAKLSHERGIDTFVDEDTTDLYFVRIAVLGEVPIERSEPIEDADWGIDELQEYPGRWYDGGLIADKAYRKGKPWFAQPKV